jgi:NADH:ubiquinone oxidoreductase subunit 3 (subunit A)
MGTQDDKDVESHPVEAQAASGDDNPPSSEEESFLPTEDWTAERTSDSNVGETEYGPSDTRKREDITRSYIAYALIGLLFLIVGCIFALLFLGKVNLADVKDIGVIFGPVVTLVSAATGFYYGTKSTASTGGEQ